jgi:hypothetical protein
LWFLQDLPLVLIASILILIIALTITGLAKHRIQNGYNHHIFSTFTIDENFVGLDYFQEGFRYRFLPVLLMYAFNYIWSGADWYYRATEPYAGMNGRLLQREICSWTIHRPFQCRPHSKHSEMATGDWLFAQHYL